MVLTSCSNCCRFLNTNQLTGTIPSSLGFNLKSLQGL